MNEPGRAVFISYASEDSTAALRIAVALRAAGIDVWLDQSELRGGDAWDTRLRSQIKACALFIPLISANTNARREGYFRREWKLAGDRTIDMDEALPFLVPVVIDTTNDAVAVVPDRFRAVQWTWLPGGAATSAFAERLRNLLQGDYTPVATPKQHAVAPPAPPEKSVAVLAFANLSTDKENEYFSDGISEELLNLLAKVPGLKVSARTSAFHFKGKNAPIPEIARQLGVAHVVEGSVRRAGERVRITAQLIKAADGFHLWSDTFTRDLKDVFAIQDEIASLIAQALKLRLEASARTDQTVDPAAYALMLEGKHFVAQRSSVAFARAEVSFKHALAIDANLAAAHAGLADLAMLRNTYAMMEGGGGDPRDFEYSTRSAMRAMELEPGLAEPHAALGLLLTTSRQFEEAEREFTASLKLNPNYGVGHFWHGLMLGSVGRIDEALAATERALNLDPLGSTALLTHSTTLLAAGRVSEALVPIERALAVRADLFPPGHGLRAVILLTLGRVDEALAEARFVREHQDAHTRWWADGDAIYVLKRAGARGEAEDFLRELRARLPPDSHVLGYALLGIGQYEEGLRLAASMTPVTWSRLFLMPMMEPVHDTPAMHALFARLSSVDHYRRSREALTRLRRGSASTASVG